LLSLAAGAKQARVTLKRFFKRTALALALLFAGAVLVTLVAGWKAFGHSASGERRARMERSPQWKDGAFENPQPLQNDAWGSVAAMFEPSGPKSPLEPLPVAAVDPIIFATAPATGLRITWLGHSAQLIEIDGHRVLTDPVWSDRASPLPWVGPTRWFKPPIALEQLPPLDAVIISHDHYDHLDYGTLTAMKNLKTVFIVPLGVGAHLEYWGVPLEHIVELDWWESTHLGDLEIVCTPARHASGRSVWDKDAKLWAGYAILGTRHRAYFSGDTGLFPAMKDIGARLGPFDVTMIETGQYHRAWPDWHIGPEQAVIAHQRVKGRVMIPVHWGLFQLAAHGWTEPVERALAAAGRDSVTIVSPRPGQSIEPDALEPSTRWWPDVAWKTGAEDPIVSTQAN
jgi:L-ascorbate metabolism protein UlaG (beta-lactamase superfamily)